MDEFRASSGLRQLTDPLREKLGVVKDKRDPLQQFV